MNSHQITIKETRLKHITIDADTYAEAVSIAYLNYQDGKINLEEKDILDTEIY